jgi:hypothetical protein
MKHFLLLVSIVAISHTQGSGKDSGKEFKHVQNVEHNIIFHQSGRFAGWPANCGAFIFGGDEIVVGFIDAQYKITDGHNAEEPFLNWLARSKDGGETWTASDPKKYAGDFGDEPKLKKLKKPISFEHPRFAMRIVGAGYHGANDGRAHFFYSYDAAKSWNGPYGFGDLLNSSELANSGLNELTPRTDYIVNGNNECLLFFSARDKDEFASDRLFCIKTSDGAKTFDFLGWVVGPDKDGTPGDAQKVELYSNDDRNPYANECRAVMSQSEKLDNGSIVSVMRRKFVIKGGSDKNWIDAYSSTDGGLTWGFLSKVANTGRGNGNPPALAVTNDGRLCVVYGERSDGTMRVVYSADKGESWSEPQILMDGFWSEDMEYNDLGYPRVVCRSDGKMVAMYYYSTKENLHHLRASIWQP